MKELNMKESDILVRFLALETDDRENEWVQHWLNESPDNMEYFMQVKSLWENTNTSLDQKYHTEDALQKTLKSISEPSKKILSKQTLIKLSIAASFLLLFGLGISLYILNTNKEIVIASSNKVISITFPDKSVVWLNKNSKLSYKKNYKRNRKVMFYGEGYFEIKPDVTHPFEITTENARITVLGTRFNVNTRNKNNTTEVVVTSGVVKLERLHVNEKDNRTIVLGKGEKGITGGQSFVSAKLPVDDPNYMSWRTHDFVFNNTNITEIARLISDIYNTEISIDSENTANCNLSGMYSCHSLDDMLDMLKTVLNITIEKKGDRISIKTNDC